MALLLLFLASLFTFFTSSEAAAAAAPAIVLAPDAPLPEQEAAQLLASWCGKLHAGSLAAPPLPIVAPGAAKGKPQFAVGVAATAALGLPAPDVALSVLGPDGYVLTSNRTASLRALAPSVALSGAPNSTGTVYAAQKLLELLGVRFLAWDETLLPSPPLLPASLQLTSPVDLTFKPAFEYRDVYGWASVATPAIARRFHQTPQPYVSPPGFVHTTYRMFPKEGPNCSSPSGCPPDDLFKSNNEWFWPRDDGKAYGQLCWSVTLLTTLLSIN